MWLSAYAGCGDSTHASWLPPILFGDFFGVLCPTVLYGQRRIGAAASGRPEKEYTALCASAGDYDTVGIFGAELHSAAAAAVARLE